MVTDAQVRRLMKLMEDTLALAAAKAGMDEKTARKYRGGAGSCPASLSAGTPGAIDLMRSRRRGPIWSRR